MSRPDVRSSDPFARPTLSGLADEIMPEQENTAVTLQGENGELWYGPVRLTRVGLEFLNALQPDELTDLFRYLLTLSGSVQWMLGDALSHADERDYGQTYQKIAEEMGYSVATLYEYVRVCRRYPKISIRIEKLDFAHHQVVAAMAEDERRKWLNWAAEGTNGVRWTVAELRNEIANAKKQDKQTPSIIMPKDARESFNVLRRVTSDQVARMSKAATLGMIEHCKAAKEAADLMMTTLYGRLETIDGSNDRE